MGAGLWAALFWALISSDCLMYLFLGETENFINAVLAVAFALLVGSPKRIGVMRNLLIGLLFAIGTLYKHNVVIVAGALAVFHVAFPPEGSNRRGALRDAGLWIGLVVLAWLCVLGYFAAVGQFGDFWDAVFRFNAYYGRLCWSGSLYELLLAKLRGLLHPPSHLWFTLPLWVLTLFGLCFRARVDNRRRMLLLGFGLGLAGMITSTGYLVYHYIIYLPLLVIGAAWGIAEADQLAGKTRRFLAPVLGLTTALLLLSHELDYLAIPGEQWTTACVNMLIYAEAPKIAKKIDTLLASNETFFVWADLPSLYIYSGREAPTRYFWLGGGYLERPADEHDRPPSHRRLGELETASARDLWAAAFVREKQSCVAIPCRALYALERAGTWGILCACLPQRDTIVHQNGVN